MSCIELRFKTATLWVWVNGIKRNGAMGGATLLIWLGRGAAQAVVIAPAAAGSGTPWASTGRIFCAWSPLGPCTKS